MLARHCSRPPLLFLASRKGPFYSPPQFDVNTYALSEVVCCRGDIGDCDNACAAITESVVTVASTEFDAVYRRSNPGGNAAQQGGAYRCSKHKLSCQSHCTPEPKSAGSTPKRAGCGSRRARVGTRGDYPVTDFSRSTIVRARQN